MAELRTGSRAGAGHSSEMATSENSDARAQPPTRSGIDDAGPGSETAMISGKSNEVVALASTELTTPANSTPNDSTAITTAASQVVREARVPTAMSTMHATARAAWHCRRLRIEPPKSTSSSMAKDPSAANVASAGLPSTGPPIANAVGMSTAARVARRSAEKPRSCWRSHSQPGSSRGMATDEGRAVRTGPQGGRTGSGLSLIGVSPLGLQRQRHRTGRASAMAVGGRHREHVRAGGQARAQGR